MKMTYVLILKKNFNLRNELQLLANYKEWVKNGSVDFKKVILILFYHVLPYEYKFSCLKF